MRIIKRHFKNLIWIVIFKIVLYSIWYNTLHTTKSYSFDVVYMNLDSNKIRSKHMEKILNFVGIAKYRRFRAVDAKQLYSSRSYLESFDQVTSIKFNIKNQKAARVNKPAQTATWLSYLFLLKDFAASSSNRPLLLLEDDVDMEADFVNLLEGSIKEAPNDWDILLCGYCCIDEMENKKVWSNLWIPIKHFSTTHCMMLRNSTVANRIAYRADLNAIEYPIDLFLAKMASSSELNIYARGTKIAIQRRDMFWTNNLDSGRIPEKEELNNSSIKHLSMILKRSY